MKKLVIVGTGTSVLDIDWSDKDIEIWGTGTCCGESDNVKDIKRLDKIFEIHRDADIIEYGINKNVNYKKFHVDTTFCINQNSPIAIQYFNNPVTYPLNEVQEFNGGHNYYNSTMDYMLCLAVMQGYRDITIHKILLYYGTEYFIQKPSLLYWIDLYRHKYPDLKITISKDSAIFEENLKYGFDEDSKIPQLLSKNKWLWEQHDLYFTRLTNAIAQFNSFYGAVQLLNKLRNDIKPEKVKEIETELIGGCNKWQGEISQNQKMIQQTNGALQVFNFFSNID